MPRQDRTIDPHTALNVEVGDRTQVGDAARFIDIARQRLLFEPSSQRWLAFDGNRWDADGAQARALQLSLASLEQFANAIVPGESGKERAAYRASRLSLHYPTRLIQFAAQTGLLNVAATDLDARSNLLGCENGIIDLRTGELLTGRPDLLVSRTTGLAYDPDATCPRFEQFLTEVQGDDLDVQEHLRLMMGYLLTGETGVQKLWVFHGIGANGKSVLLETLLAVLGDYGIKASGSVLLGRENYGGPRPDIARLAGARLVAVSETDRRDPFSEARVKELTGGERIATRTLYRDEFEFVPAAKFVLATNGLPTVSGSDNGLWRRILVVPFERTFDTPDPSLGRKLRAELPGILALAVRGAVEFYAANGRIPIPKRYEVAGREYRADQDTFGSFLAEHCELDTQASVGAASIQRAYANWCEQEGRVARDWQTVCARALRERGCTARRYGRENRSHWFGVRLRSPEAENSG
jgi:putative DNA primase/helicase